MAAIPVNILAVDDSASMRDLISMALERAGFDVKTAENGQDALDKLTPEIDVVITDLNMPLMNGMELVRAVRSRKEHVNTPILLLTTESQREKKDQAKEAGATGWIVKPFQDQKLISAIRHLVGA